MKNILDFFNGTYIVHFIAIIAMFTCSYIVIRTDDQSLKNKYFDTVLVGVVGWAFTQSAKRKDDNTIATVSQTVSTTETTNSSDAIK